LPCNRKQRYLQHNKYNMSIIEQFLRFVAPHHCLGCGREGQLLCRACANGLPAVPPRCYGCGTPRENYHTCPACYPKSPLYAVMPATVYQDLAKTVVHRLKFERAQAAANDIAAVMAARLPLEGIEVITFVPTAPARVRTRGYDQAALIAKALARRTGLPCQALLGRSNNERQVGKGRTARHQQMAGAFYARHAPAGRHVLLVDDVLTTGATCEAAARVLLAGGAGCVSEAIFAAA
jgi:ComF family protein